MFWNDIEEIKEWMNRLTDRLIRIEDFIHEIMFCVKKTEENEQKTMDKIADCMKNVDKLNLMINEFKGCVSMSRASLKNTKGRKKEKKSE